jgi:hypothetical protein
VIPKKNNPKIGWLFHKTNKWLPAHQRHLLFHWTMLVSSPYTLALSPSGTPPLLLPMMTVCHKCQIINHFHSWPGQVTILNAGGNYWYSAQQTTEQRASCLPECVP